MKKIIIAAIVLISMSIHAYAGPIISIHCEIGRKSLGCSKFGFCDWGVSVDFKSTSNINGTVQWIENTNTLQLNLTREAIVGKEDYFKGNTIVIEEDFIVPFTVQKALGLNTKTTIKPGTYKLVSTQKGYQIDIALN